MFADVDPSLLPAAVGLAAAIVVLCAALAIRNALRRRHEMRAVRAARPKGADAALWSVTEALPDPRNHIQVKDPTSEMRIRAGTA